MSKAAFSIIAVFIIAALGVFFSYVSFHNNAIKAENGVAAQWRDNQNEYDAFWKSVTEMAQVPEKYKDDLREVLRADVEGRYGTNGSQATMQWIQEHAINFDSTMYKALMEAIESGRRRFAANQRRLIDRQRAYNDEIQSFGGSIWANLGGFPHEMRGANAPPSDLDDDGRLTVLDYPIITSKRTSAAFASGQDDALTIFPDKG